ncbi:TetR/AcrR family transcriptional regulator [Herbiconiux sp. P17]|uniref:TetR/AcrR family transcriptional regulator n=1 Tax=Herbiconiux wuyangfengii TaxID=3342794 RepID=UPI0035BAFA7B
MSDDPESPGRTTYRHGDLRGALIAAGVEMAREGGPRAVVLREATRRAGVSPNAAYRHFADRAALLHVVSDTCLGFAADRIQQAIDEHPPTGDAEADARMGLRAVGVGYIAFAREEPGLFRTAFSVPDDLRQAASPTKAGRNGLTPFQLVGGALDALVAAGVIPPERRENAEFLAWAAVHGLGMLVIDGPLRGLDDRMIDYSTERLLDMVDRGL